MCKTKLQAQLWEKDILHSFSLCRSDVVWRYCLTGTWQRKDITRVISNFKSYKPLDEVRDDSVDLFKIQVTPSDGDLVGGGGDFPSLLTERILPSIKKKGNCMLANTIGKQWWLSHPNSKSDSQGFYCDMTKYGPLLLVFFYFW